MKTDPQANTLLIADKENGGMTAVTAPEGGYCEYMSTPNGYEILINWKEYREKPDSLLVQLEWRNVSQTTYLSRDFVIGAKITRHSYWEPVADFKDLPDKYREANTDTVPAGYLSQHPLIRYVPWKVDHHLTLACYPLPLS